MPFDLDTSASTPLLNRISKVFSPAVADQVLLYGGARVGLAMEEAIRDDADPSPSGKALPLWYVRVRKDGTQFQSKFKSLKQQRKVMALAKEGKIPYKRTGTLSNSITSAAVLQGAGLVFVRAGSNISYAKYVIDQNDQSHYFAGNWIPVQTSVRNKLPQIAKVFEKAVAKDVKRRLGNG